MATILAGPALRHTNAQGVFIWLVLSEKATTIDATLFDKAMQQVGHATPESKRPVKLGERLYIYLLEAAGDGSDLALDQKYFYDITINGRNLAQSGLIGGETSLTYPEQPLPSFFIPAMHQQILQGACRKPHAHDGRRNVIDKTIEIDHLLEATVDDLQARPSLWCHTGDQIYADDVGLPLVSLLSELGVWLTGYREQMPTGKSKRPWVDVADISPGKRDKYINRKSGFSDGDNENHLMTFGEYIAMYLVAWGGLQDQINFKDFDAAFKKHRPKKCRIDKWLQYTDKKRQYAKEKKILARFFRNATHMRRAMAHVPNYMIFDDHDVTDDWNLDRRLARRFDRHPLSQRVLCNALSAFWACQAWGNQPCVFGDRLPVLLQNHFGQQGTARADGTEDTRLTVEKALIDEQYWGFVIPSNPPLIMLDTRTQRDLGRDGPALMNGWAMNWLRDQLQALPVNAKTENLIVVSPTPVFGFKKIEAIQMKMPRKLALIFDLEPWVANGVALDQLQSILSRSGATRNVLILSGDVHYAFCRYEASRDKTSGKTTKYFQLTSTALCNIAPGRQLGRTVVSSLQNLSLFSRERTHYLIPEQETEDFITADTNFGLLSLDGHGPVKAWLACSHDKDTHYRWVYDLRHPKVLRSPATSPSLRGLGRLKDFFVANLELVRERFSAL